MVHKENFTVKEMSNINQCRIFLNVLTLSDISTINGKYINVDCFQHKTATTMISSKGPTAKVEKPNKSVWSYWQKFLQKITTYNSRRLSNQLGEWTVPTQEIRRQYNTYRDNLFIYKRGVNHVEKRHINTKEISIVGHIPQHAIPCIQTITGIIPQEFYRQTTKPITPSNHTQQTDIDRNNNSHGRFGTPRKISHSLDHSNNRRPDYSSIQGATNRH